MASAFDVLRAGAVEEHERERWLAARLAQWYAHCLAFLADMQQSASAEAVYWRAHARHERRLFGDDNPPRVASSRWGVLHWEQVARRAQSTALGCRGPASTRERLEWLGKTIDDIAYEGSLLERWQEKIHDLLGEYADLVPVDELDR